MNFSELLRAIKTEYGINQTTLARQMGTSPQILTDIKAGRRRLSPAMAESILLLFSHERDAGWVAEALDGVLLDTVNAAPSSPIPPLGMYLPVMDALCRSDPHSGAQSTGRTVLIPEGLASFVGEAAFSYVLALDYDDYAGRLRAGDLILIVQNVSIIKEIMVVESRGRLRLARNAACGTGSTEAAGKEQWLALDTGKTLELGLFVGMAAGIVTAIL